MDQEGIDDAALKLEWSFGMHHSLTQGTRSLSDGKRVAMVYAAAHTAIIYDCEQRTQKLLQGHCNVISAIVVSEDKRYIVTADKGKDSIIVVWDSFDGSPLRTIFNPSPNGVAALDLSEDDHFLAVLSAPNDDEESLGHGSTQTLSVWEWADMETDEPVIRRDVSHPDKQVCVRFNPMNLQEIVTNGAKQALFWSWTREEMLCFTPRVSKAKFRQGVAPFTASVFLTGPSKGKVITGTTHGDVLLWERTGAEIGASPGTVPPSQSVGEWSAIKLLHLAEGALNCVQTSGKFVVLAGEDGAVRFYDMTFRLEAWFEDMEAGSITSVSFSSSMESSLSSAVSRGEQSTRLDFTCPDFMVATSKAYVVGMHAGLFEEVDPEARRGMLLVQGMCDTVEGIAMHPNRHELAITSFSGDIYLWDFGAKVLLMARRFDASRLRPSLCAFDPTGNYLALAFTNGVVKILDPATLEDIITFKTTFKDPVIHMSFSPQGDFLAAADTDRHVALWKLQVLQDSEDDQGIGRQNMASDGIAGTWVYLGRTCSHSDMVTSLTFGMRENGTQCLVSTGRDRRLVEYDLVNSTVEDGVCLKEGTPVRVEEWGTPTASVFHPLLGTGATREFEDRVVVASDQFKLTQWNADSKTCRRTSLGPTFGGPVTCLVPLVPPNMQHHANTHTAGVGANSEALSVDRRKQYFAYATAERVIGMGKFPIDGNPHKNMGLIAHPGTMSGLAVSFDGRFIATAGGSDQTVNLWSVHVQTIDQSEAASVSGAQAEGSVTTVSALPAPSLAPPHLSPFLALLEGGEGGEVHNNIVDFFYYAQLRAQGEDSTAPREITNEVVLSEVPDMMRGLGFYPSQTEVEHMLNEVKYSEFTTTGKEKSTISLPEFVKLYVNHRPVAGVSKEQIEDAFAVIAQTIGGAGSTLASGGASRKSFASGSGGVEWEALKKMLMEHGDAMSKEELQDSLRALIGTEDLPDSTVTSEGFIGEVLGFEDYEQEQSYDQAI